MPNEILGHFRPGMPIEVGRRSDDGYSKERRNPDGDHVPVDLLTKPHAGVEALGHYVDQSVI